MSTKEEAPVSKRGKPSNPPVSHKTAPSAEGKAAHGSKAEFIRRHMSKKPAEVVELAKAEGIKLDANYVATQQSKERNKGKKGTRKKTVERAGLTGAEAEFKRLLKRIGSDRARVLIKEYEAE